MSTTELKSNLLKMISAINDSGALKDIYEFVSGKDAKAKQRTHSEETFEEEKKEWERLSMRILAKTYGEDEPDYSNAKIIEYNPEYRENK